MSMINSSAVLNDPSLVICSALITLTNFTSETALGNGALLCNGWISMSCNFIGQRYSTNYAKLFASRISGIR